MSRFSTFAVLYMASLLLELAELWKYPRFTIGVLLLIALVIWRGITPAGFFVVLAVTTLHFVLVQFPEVANHVNLAIYCSIVLMIGIGYAGWRKRRFPTDDDLFELVRPQLQLSLVLVYVLAGFHKLNADFLDPEVSCARSMIGRLATMSRSEFLGLPAALFLAAGLLPAAYLLLSRSRWRQHLLAAGVLGAVVVAGMVALVAVAAAPGTSSVLRAGVLAMAVVTILWELGGGLLLTVPRLQAAMLLFSWVMHATLALVSFVDFGALALALLFVFVPRPWFTILNQPVRLPVAGVSVTRIHLYFALAVLAGLAQLLGRFPAGLLFNLAALVFIWPILAAALASPPGPAWTGVPLTSPMTPRWMLVFPVILLLHGLTGYLGLRTAGNFSMFSNIRTEGSRSNHYLLRNNPLKIWDFQEDAVEFRPPEHEAGTGLRIDLPGYRLPVVEFRKMVRQWTETGTTMAVTFEYQGRVYSSPDIANDPVWRVSGRDWKMMLMDFRVIQPDGPNQCRW